MLISPPKFDSYKKIFTRRNKNNYGHSLILSYIDYCNSVLAGSTNKDLKPLQKIINKAVRFIYDLRRREHVSPYAFRAHFLPIYYRIQFKVCLLAYKIINALSPDYLSEGLEMYQPTTLINLRVGQGRDNFMFQNPPLKSQHNSLFNKLISSWNSLPYNIRTTTTLQLFKTKLKTHFFKKAYPTFIDHGF